MPLGFYIIMMAQFFLPWRTTPCFNTAAIS